MKDYSGFFEAAISASPTLVIAYVLEYRYYASRSGDQPLYFRNIGRVIVISSMLAFAIAVWALIFDGQHSIFRAILTASLLFLSIGFLSGLFFITFEPRSPLEPATPAPEDY